MLQPLTTATTTATTYFKPLQLIVLVQAIHANVPPARNNNYHLWMNQWRILAHPFFSFFSINYHFYNLHLKIIPFPKMNN